MKKLILITFMCLCIQSVFVQKTYTMGGKVSGENIPTQLHWTLCESSLNETLKKIPLTRIKDIQRTQQELDTVNKDLKKNKYFATLHKENGRWSSQLKMDYDDPREIPDFIPPSMNCENNYYKNEKFLSCTIQNKKASPKVPLSETQEDAIENKLKKDILAIAIVASEEKNNRLVQFTYKSKTGKKHTLTIRELSSLTNELEISTRISRILEEPLYIEITEFLAAQKISLCPDQKSARHKFLF